MIYKKELNSRFFYKVFVVITLIIIVCSTTVSLLIYYRFTATMAKQKKDFIVYTSNQVKTNIINLTKNHEQIAGNIYSDNDVGLLLKEGYYKDMDINLYQMFNKIGSSFQGILENNREINSICIYKMDHGLMLSGKEVKDISQFKRQDLIKKAIDAKGNNVWASYNDDDGKLRFCLLKYLNLYKPGGVLIIELKGESFFNLYKSAIGDKNNLFIIDNYHNIISSNQKIDIGKNINTLLKVDVLQNISEKEVYYNSNSNFFYTDKINDAWSIVFLYDSHELNKEKRYMTYYVSALTIIFIVIGLIFSFFSASKFARQVDKLMVKIKEIERGNLKIQPDIKKVNEFYQLDKTLCSMAQNIDKLTTDIVKAVKQKEEIEIKYLQMQMNPHFLYNLLSVIRWIAFNNQQEKIITVVDNLSNFYRIALSKGSEIIPINSEISLVKSYIELQNLYCSPGINFTVNINEELSNIKISKMTLQPFIENSVVHGRVGDRELNIVANIVKMDENIISITIEDDGVGVSEEVVNYIKGLNEEGSTMEGKHYGITNTLARLNLLYNDGVTIYAAKKHPGSRIELVIRTSLKR